jgi:hypothetical protein
MHTQFICLRADNFWTCEKPRKACSESVNLNSVNHILGVWTERVLINRQALSLISNYNLSNSEFLFPVYSRILPGLVPNYFKSNPHLSCLFYYDYFHYGRHTVTQLVVALCYKPRGRGLDFPYHWNFSFT